MASAFSDVVIGWSVSSFFAATLDAVFHTSTINKKSKLIGTFAALLQLTLATSAISSVLIRLGSRRAVTGPDLWICIPATWSMSTNAVATLAGNYKAFHKIFYDSALPQAGCCDECESGDDECPSGLVKSHDGTCIPPAYPLPASGECAEGFQKYGDVCYPVE